MKCHRKVIIVWIDADDLEDGMEKKDPVKYHNAWSQLTSAAGGKSCPLSFPLS